MSEAIFNLDAEVRTDLGKGASRRLRREDKVPAILYGDDKEPVSLTLDHNKVVQAQEFEAFYSHVLTLNVDGKKIDALLKDMQRHPYKPKILHLDFQRVDAKKKVTTQVPLHFINEDKAPAIKTEGGHAEHQMIDVEVSCLPGNLPEFLEIDVMDLALGDTLHLSDIKLPKGVELVELSKGEDHDQAVVTIKAAKGGSTEADDAQGDSEEATEE